MVPKHLRNPKRLISRWRGTSTLADPSVEASGRLVGPPVFKTGERPTRSLAGSIPVRLRHFLAKCGRQDSLSGAACPQDGRTLGSRVYSVDARRGPRIPSFASLAEHRLEVTDMPKNLATATSVGFTRLALGEMA